MAKTIIMPKMGNTVESVVIGEVFVKVGDKIEVGQTLFEYETDKTSVEFVSEDAGTITEIKFAEGDEIDVLAEIIVIEE